MLFQVPHLREPLISCIDLEVEKDFHPVFLGLGDVIVPGILLHSFYYFLLLKNEKFFSEMKMKIKMKFNLYFNIKWLV